MLDDQHGQSTPRVPPHNLEAEAALLGAAMLSADAADVVSGLSSTVWYSPANRILFDAVRTVHRAGCRVDDITVGDELRRAGMLGEVGGIVKLSELQQATPSVSGAAHYATIVRDAAEHRELILLGNRLADQGFDSHDVGEAIAALRDNVEMIAARRIDVENRTTLQWLDPSEVLGGLEPEEPLILTRTDGAALFYPGKLHWIQAEPTSGKSWIAIVAALQVVAMGGAVLYIDHEDSGRGIVRRCQEAGATIDADFLTRFRYVEPEAGLGLDEMSELFAVIDELQPDLVIVDGVAESLSRCGLSEDVAADVMKWADLLPRPLARTGAAVVMLDHVIKNKEDRGRYARGSGAKLALIDGTAYNVQVRKPFDRHTTGTLELVVDKDRPGGVGATHTKVAKITLEPHAAGERLVITVDPYTEDLSTSDAWRPTILMEKVSKVVEDAAAPMPLTTVKHMVHADKPGHLREAMARLLHEGFVVEKGRPKVLHSVRPFRAAWDRGDSAERPEIVPPEPTEDPQLFAVPEPDHLEEERRAALDSLWQDPEADYTEDPEEDPT